MFLFPSHRSLPRSTAINKSKDDIALDDMTFKFNSILQTCMKNAGYDFLQREIYHKTFLTFKHLSAMALIQRLQCLTSKTSLETDEKVKNCYDRLQTQTITPLHKDDAKMNNAIKIMNEEIYLHFKHCLLQADFEEHKTQENNKSYLQFLSNFIILETEKIFRDMTRFKSSEEISTSKPSSSLQLLNNNTQISENIIYSNVASNDNIVEEQFNSTHLSKILLSSTRKHLVYLMPSKNIVMKVLKSNNPSVKDIANLDNEFEVAKNISHPAFRSSINRTVVENKQGLLLEWAPGIPISTLETVMIKDFLTIAREIVSSLLEMHMMQFIHHNLSSDHIIIDKESLSIKIIGCGSSTSFESKKTYLANHELFGNDLRFISPERTGRINRNIDYRSDFYSLGIIFYQLLAGTYPFESKNAFELLHLHIGQAPVQIRTINPNIPVSLSDMVSKLMEKDADDRYQSTKGIIHDLDLMIVEYENDEQLSSVELSQHDVPETLIIPQKLYGDSTNYKALLSVFDKVQGAFEVVLVLGDSGTGKSALVFELYKPITQKAGIFLRGKYDFSKSEPYSAILEAFNNFCDDLLLRDESTVNCFKRQIQNAIGDEGKLLCDVITSLHLVIGEQPYASDAFGKEAKNRFTYVFIKFIKAICTVGLPIVLVLEDLQWMDIDSFHLLSALITEKSIINFMFIGIYRQNEVYDAHPVKSLLRNMEKEQINLTYIEMDNLGHEYINDFISDTLHIPSFESYALTAYVHEKTNGNAFFVSRMLKSLAEEGTIFYCNDSRRWKWDATIFGERGKYMYENVKQLLRLKFLSFDEQTQQTLKVASCLGSSFSLRALKLIVNRTDGIEGALATNMISQCKGSDTMYHFVHDNIQEAACLLLPENPKPLYLYIGKKLWALFSKEELHENIFVVVHLLHNGIGMVQNQEERSQIAELFMEAGKKAMASTAFTQAYEYLDIGINLLGKDCWETNYSLSLNLYDVGAESAYCTSKYDCMNRLLEETFKNANTAIDVVRAYSLQIKEFSAARRYEDSIDVGIRILNMLGEKISGNICVAMTDAEILRVRLTISQMSYEQILETKEMEDKVVLSIVMILDGLLVPCTFSNIQLACSISSRIAQLTLKYGISKQYSPKGFSSFGSVLCRHGDKVGFKCGMLAIKLLEKFQVKENIPLVYVAVYGLMWPFFSSVHESIAPFLKAYTISLEVGSYENSVHSANSYCMYAFLIGKPLPKLMEDIDELMNVLPTKTSTFLCIYQSTRNLLNSRYVHQINVKGKYFDNSLCFAENEKASDKGKTSLYCCFVAYLFHDYKSALAFADVCREHLINILSTYLHPIFLLYDSLVSLQMAKAKGCEEEEKEKWIKNAEGNLENLKSMAQHAPQNYMNKIHLVEAEMAIICNRRLDGLMHYQRAISLSNKNNFPNEEAIACELLGMYHFSLGELNIANRLLLQSYGCYQLWGAESKKAQLIQRNPSIAEKIGDFEALCDTELLLDNHSVGTVSLISCNTHSNVSSTSPERKRPRL